MAATESNMLPLGTAAPSFALPDADDNVYALNGAGDADAAPPLQKPGFGCSIKWRPGNAPDRF